LSKKAMSFFDKQKGAGYPAPLSQP
jgi:hypothetical protein